MDYKYIEQLLERYWNCETSLEEESILRSFFAQKDVPVTLLPYRDLFVHEQNLCKEHLDETFDQRVIEAIGMEKESVKVHRLSIRQRFAPFMKAAAGIAILLTLGMSIQQAIEDNGETDAHYGYTAEKPTYVQPDRETAYERSTAMPDTTKDVAVSTNNNESF